MNTADISYLRFRMWVGILGLFLPISVRVVGFFVDGLSIRDFDTISAHYYSSARDIFVATMVLNGGMLFFIARLDTLME